MDEYAYTYEEEMVLLQYRLVYIENTNNVFGTASLLYNSFLMSAIRGYCYQLSTTFTFTRY